MDDKDADQHQQTCAVSRILEHRTIKQNQGSAEYEYLVRWKNETNDTEMDKSMDTWEPTTSFIDGDNSSAIQDYWKEFKAKQQQQQQVQVQPQQQPQQQQQPKKVVMQATNQPTIMMSNQTQFVQYVPQPQQIYAKTQQGQLVLINQPQQAQQRILQQPIQVQQLNMSPQGHQGPIQYILSPSHHAIASPLSSPVQLNQAGATLVRSAHQASVIKPNQAFAPLVVKSPSSSQTSTPSRRVSESRTEELVKSPTSSSQAAAAAPKLDLSMLAEAADSMGYMKQEPMDTTNTTTNQAQSTEFPVKTELVEIPQPLVTPTPPAPTAPTTTSAATPTPTQPTKKPRGRPKGLTKAVLEERKKNEAAKPEKAKPVKKKPAPKKPRLPKQAPVKEGLKAAEETRKRAEQALKEMESSSSNSSSSDPDSSDQDSDDSSDDDRQPKIRPSGGGLTKQSIKQRRKSSTSKETPPKKEKIKKNQEKSPEKAKRRQSVASSLDKRRESISSNMSNPFDMDTSSTPTPAKQRRDSLTSKTQQQQPVQAAAKQQQQQQPQREVNKVEDLKWAVKTIGKKDFFGVMKANERPPVIGWITGQLAREVERATTCKEGEQDLDSLARKLVGCCYVKDGAPISIPDEINAKNRDSALCVAAKVRAQDGGPAIINALCGIGGADPNQRTAKNENTALHIAAEQGIPGNVSALLAFKAPINWRNGNNLTPLHLAVERASKMEKFAKQIDSDEIRRNYDDAYACVELLLSAGADIYPEIVQSAGQSDVADIIYHYNITINTEIYNFIKRSMGKCSLNVHNQLVAAVTCVPSDQNIIELVLPEMENMRPNFFLMLFAVHGDYFGYGAELARLDNLRLSGNPCLVTDVVWHKPRVGNHKEVNQSIDGLVSIGRRGPFEPGKAAESYTTQEYDTHFVTVLDYVPYRKNKLSLSIMPAHWTKEKIFIRVYPCELVMTNQFKNSNPEIPRVMKNLDQSYQQMEEEVRRARDKWRKELKKECDILLEGKKPPKGNMKFTN